MNGTCGECALREVYEVRYESLAEKLDDLKERVARLETVVSRGVALLVVNLIGVVATLGKIVVLG